MKKVTNYMNVGIIGGADGPTSIFITSGSVCYIIAAAAVVCIAVVGTIIWVIKKINAEDLKIYSEDDHGKA